MESLVTGRRGPSLAKARGPSLVASSAARVRGVDACWRAMFASADVVSEGAARDEGGSLVWYGTTSLILALPEATASDERDFIAAFAANDLHVRLRALRAAHREAQSRAPGTLGQTACEIRVSSDTRGVRIDVDVQAPLIVGGVRATRRPRR